MGTAADPASERVIVDPNRLDSSGTTTIDYYEPSLDGRLIAVSLSKGGTVLLRVNGAGHVGRR